jgi:hypothetical protein
MNISLCAGFGEKNFVILAGERTTRDLSCSVSSVAEDSV